MVSEWFGIVSQVLWREGEGILIQQKFITMLLAAMGAMLSTRGFSWDTAPPVPVTPGTGLLSWGMRPKGCHCL